MVKQSNSLVAVTGFSGAGKDAVASELVRRGYVSVIPHTTRPMRVGEAEGSPYNFVSQAVFDQMIEAGDFIEYNSYQTEVAGIKDRWYYGTAKSAILPNTKNILTVGVQSSVRSKQALDGNAVIVFLDVPDTIRETRAMDRGSFDKQEWDNRLRQDIAFRKRSDIATMIDINIDNTTPLHETADNIEKELHAQY